MSLEEELIEEEKNGKKFVKKLQIFTMEDGTKQKKKTTTVKKLAHGKTD